jgi:hypothetical protein
MPPHLVHAECTELAPEHDPDRRSVLFPRSRVRYYMTGRFPWI